jgi:hypothetical protein
MYNKCVLCEFSLTLLLFHAPRDLYAFPLESR